MRQRGKVDDFLGPKASHWGHWKLVVVGRRRSHVFSPIFRVPRPTLRWLHGAESAESQAEGRPKPLLATNLNPLQKKGAEVTGEST